MNQQEIYDLCKRAFMENEIEALLKGEEPFVCPTTANTPGLIPTDWESLLRSGIFPLCKADATGILMAQLRRAVKGLLKGDILDIWCAYNVYFYACYSEPDEGKGRKLADEALRAQLRQVLYRNKEALRVCRLWQGKYDPEGLWGDIFHADQALQKRFQMGVL